jgi:hypothetical protein
MKIKDIFWATFGLFIAFLPFIILFIILLAGGYGIFYAGSSYCLSIKAPSQTYVDVTNYNFLKIIPDEYLVKFSEKSNEFLNGSQGFLGFDAGFCQFIPDLIVGFCAGFFMWVVFIFISGIKFLKEGANPLKSGKRTKNPFEKSKYGWLSFVAGALWKVLVFALFYSILMQLPIIAGVIKVITLDFYFDSIFIKSLILAFLVGYLPAFFEYFWKEMIKIKAQMAIDREKREADLAKDVKTK